MGGTSFENEYRGTASMADAYRELVEQAFYEQGHDPYNGTISTTSGVIQDPGVKEPMTATEAYERAQWWFQDDLDWDDPKLVTPQKWEAAWAIPLKPDEPTDAMLSNPWAPPLDRGLPGWLFYGMAAC